MGLWLWTPWVTLGERCRGGVASDSVSGSWSMGQSGLAWSRSGVAALDALSEDGSRRGRSLPEMLSMAASAIRPPMTDAPPWKQPWHARPMMIPIMGTTGLPNMAIR